MKCCPIQYLQIYMVISSSFIQNHQMGWKNNRTVDNTILVL